MARKARPKSLIKMSRAERDKEVAKYEAGLSLDETRPLTVAEQARWERACSSRTPDAGKDDKVAVVIRIDPRLLAKAHAAAKRDGKSLSTLISELLAQAQRRGV